MQVCPELNKNLKIANTQIKHIFGTNGDDDINLKCSNIKSQCDLEINKVKCSFSTNQLLEHGLIIDGLNGNDKFKIDVAPEVFLLNINLYTGDGNNSVDYKLNYPYSSGSVKLGNGVNDLYIGAQDGSNIIVFGFNNVPQNKIHFTNSQGAKFSDLVISRAAPQSEIYDLVLNEKTMLQLLNYYSLQEEELVVAAKVAESMGRPLPKDFIDSGLSLYSPKPIEEALAENSFLFY